MPFDSEIALLGTGIAPLIAANHLINEGKSVLLINPDWDFFMEDSELPLDPLWPILPQNLTVEQLLRNSPESALLQLRPEFPGAIELWPDAREGGYHDLLAPHVRNRSRVWVQSRDEDWSTIEAMYVDASDAGLHPQILEGLLAVRKFPGVSQRAHSEQMRAVVIPKMSDVDVSRYRNGLLEFMRERLGQERVICAASQIDLIPEGIRFYAKGAPHTARLKEGLMVFWTPRLTQWILAQAKKAEAEPVLPLGIRLWEEWSLVSREALDPAVIGSFENMTVWAEVEGVPEKENEQQHNGQGTSHQHRLAVLRAGPLIELDQHGSKGLAERGETWASTESFKSLSRLCHDFLRWDRFSVRSMKPRAILEWDRNQVQSSAWSLSDEVLKYQVIPACDGPMVEIIRNTRMFCDRLMGPSL